MSEGFREQFSVQILYTLSLSNTLFVLMNETSLYKKQIPVTTKRPYWLASKQSKLLTNMFFVSGILTFSKLKDKNK